MNYLNITRAKIKEELLSLKEKIIDDAKDKAEKIIQFQIDAVCVTFFVSLLTLGISAMAFTGSDDSALITTISFYIGVISLIVFVGSVPLAVLFHSDSYEKYNYKRSYKKVYKKYCEKYKVDSLEDDSNLQKILVSIFEEEFLEDKSDIEIYQSLYVDEMLKPDELDKINEFLRSNKISFKGYALALDNKLLAHIVNPYRNKIKREIEEAVADLFLEKDREKQEEERVKSAERQKQEGLVKSSNTFASSMLGKNLAI